MSEHQPTPRLTLHARQRCTEMGVRTTRVKAILRDPDMTWGGHTPGYAPGVCFAWSRRDPAIGVYFCEEDGAKIAVTVVPRTTEIYERKSESA